MPGSQASQGPRRIIHHDQAERLGRVETRLDTVETRLTKVESTLDDTNTRVRSLEDTTGEIKELLIRALER